MKKIKNLYHLFLNQLYDLYDGNIRQLKFLNDLINRADSTDLQDNIDQYHRETKRQNNRLNQIFVLLNEDSSNGSCYGIKAMIKGTEKLLESCNNSAVCDAAIITAVQHINNYEIAGYGTALSYAKALNKHEIGRILLDSLRECKNADAELSELALNEINSGAI